MSSWPETLLVSSFLPVPVRIVFIWYGKQKFYSYIPPLFEIVVLIAPTFIFIAWLQDQVADINGSYVIRHDEAGREYGRRNRNYIRIDINNIELRIGRDMDKCIPGKPLS